MEGHMLMSVKERLRKSLLERVCRGELSLRDASAQLGLCYRQTRRVYKEFRAHGDAGLVHRARGRPSNRCKPVEFRERVLKRCVERYLPLGMGPTLMAEKLTGEGLAVDEETLRRWLLKAGLWRKRRKSSKHHAWRARREHFGDLVQIDGSHHQWFGPERPRCCLMVAVDDATGYTLALLAEEETTEAAMRLMRWWVELFGAPRSIYADRKTVYFTDREPTLEEQLANEQPLTSFGKSCTKLGIEAIRAHSPQAKGRVERKHAVFQDRFVKELALRRIKTIASANRLLHESFLDGLNQRYTKEPAGEGDYHRAVPDGLCLDDVFCFEEERTLNNDWTISFERNWYQVLEENRPLPRPREKVTVRKRLNGEVLLEYKKQPLQFRRLPLRELCRRQQKTTTKPAPAQHERAPLPIAKTRSKTPWRHNCTLMFADPKDQP